MLENVHFTERSAMLIVNGFSGKLRDKAERNGLSALVMPALAADHSTGSDLSQVRVNFLKDTSIIKHLIGCVFCPLRPKLGFTVNLKASDAVKSSLC